MSLRTHLDVLQDSAAHYSERPVFKLPALSPESKEVHEWAPVTYAQFKADVERYARHWSRVLAADGLPRQSVIGVW